MFSKLITMSALATTSANAAWVESKVGDMTVWSNAPAKYDKVVILLHGGGGSPEGWKGVYDYSNGDSTKTDSKDGKDGKNTGFSLGDTSKTKYVVPASTMSGGVWYTSTKKDGCTASDDCAYDLATISTSGDQIKAVIDNEKKLGSYTDSTKIYLGGYSQGSQMASYVQLNKMKEALGGVILFNGWPLPPTPKLADKTTAEAQAVATYYGSDMRWMAMYGAHDPIFPGEESKKVLDKTMEKLGASKTIKISVVEDVGH